MRSTEESEVWHGYPEARDKMDLNLKKNWRKAGLISRKDLRTDKTRQQVRDKFGGRIVGHR